MSTRAVASAVFNVPIEVLWTELRDFRFNGTYLSTIASVSLVEGSSGVELGAVRETKWETGEIRHHRLLEVSDLHYRAAWELVYANPPAEHASKITTLR